MISIKLSYKGEIRRAAISKSSFNYESLNNFARRLFPLLNEVRKFSFSWTDDDGDKITMSSNEELLEAFRIGEGESTGLLRFEVSLNENDVPNKSSESAAPNITGILVHNGVRCDECDISPIVGIRYKCTMRHDYDLCESCEAKRVQPYPMIKCYAPLCGPIPGIFPHPVPQFHGAHHYPPPPHPHDFHSYNNPMHDTVDGHHAQWHHHRHGPRPGRCHGRGFGRGFRPCRDSPPRGCPFRRETFEEAKSNGKTFNVADFIDMEALKKFCSDTIASSKSVDTDALKRSLSETISKVLDRVMQFRHPSTTSQQRQQQQQQHPAAASTESDVERSMFEAAVRESMEELESSTATSAATTSTTAASTPTSTSHAHIIHAYGTEESKSTEEPESASEEEQPSESSYRILETVVGTIDNTSIPTATATTTSTTTTATVVAAVATDDTRSMSSSNGGSMDYQMPLDWEFVNMHRSQSPPTPTYYQMRSSYTSFDPAPAEAEVAPVEPIPVSSAPSAAPVASPPNELDIWKVELRILADMGFVDPLAVIPLLNEHAFPAFSQQPAETAAIKEEGIQRVVNVLLSGI